MFYAQLNNIGTILRLDISKLSDDTDWDVSTATTKEIFLKSDGGTVGTFTAENVTDGTDGQIQYETVDTADLSEIGRWMIQGHCIFPDGKNLRTRPAYFKVIANLA
jgi:hypothetical protein